MAHVITPDGTIRELPKGEISLATAQGIVGGYIEMLHIGKNIPVFNEEGKLKGLPINEPATELARGKIGPEDYLVGNVIFASSRDFK